MAAMARRRESPGLTWLLLVMSCTNTVSGFITNTRMKATKHYTLDEIGNEPGVYQKALFFKPSTKPGPVKLEPFLDSNLTDVTPKWTVSLWVKMAAIPSEVVYLMYSGGPENGPSLYIRDSKLVFQIGTTVGTISVDELKPVGSWHIIQLSIEPELPEITIDGIIPAVYAYAESRVNLTTSMTITFGGYDANDPKTSCNCAIDDIKIWLPAITDNELLYEVYLDGKIRVEATVEDLQTTGHLPLFEEDGDNTTCSLLHTDAFTVRDTFVQIEWDAEPSFMTRQHHSGNVNFVLSGWFEIGLFQMYVGGEPGTCYRMVECSMIVHYPPGKNPDWLERIAFRCNCDIEGCARVYVSLSEVCTDGVDCLSVYLCDVMYQE